MPELPEVETIRRVLEPQLQGLTIEKVTVARPEVVAYPSAEAFCKLLEGQKISGMSRRGKFLSVLLESGAHVTLHLRMTGCLLFVPPEHLPEKHTHITFRLSGGCELRFSDMRRFGRFWLLQKDETDTYSGIGKLGIEPFDDKLTADYLRQQLGRRKKAVKECLLEQDIIAGIGNIYADEILFAAGIHPKRSACSLGSAEWEGLARTIPERLAYYIEKNAITPEEYLAGRGQDYRNTPFLQVYGHAKEPCPKCGSTLCRIVVVGRGSVYCPDCQKE